MRRYVRFAPWTDSLNLTHPTGCLAGNNVFLHVHRFSLMVDATASSPETPTAVYAII